MPCICRSNRPPHFHFNISLAFHFPAAVHLTSAFLCTYLHFCLPLRTGIWGRGRAERFPDVSVYKRGNFFKLISRVHFLVVLFFPPPSDVCILFQSWIMYTFFLVVLLNALLDNGNSLDFFQPSSAHSHPQ